MSKLLNQFIKYTLCLSITVIMLLAANRIAYAANYYAAPTALGTEDCSSEENACTIATAVTTANASETDDTINLAVGTYSVGATLEITDPVNLIGAGRGLDPTTATILVPSGSFNTITLTCPDLDNDFEISGITIQAYYQKTAIYITDGTTSSSPTIKDNLIISAHPTNLPYYGIYAYDTGSSIPLKIDGNIFAGFYSEAVYLYGSGGSCSAPVTSDADCAVVKNNIFNQNSSYKVFQARTGGGRLIYNNIITGNTGNAGTGIYLRNCSTGNYVLNNTIYGNPITSSGAGITISGSCSGVHVENNIIANNEMAKGLNCASGSGTVILNNLIANNGTNSVTIGSTCSSTYSADDQFFEDPDFYVPSNTYTSVYDDGEAGTKGVASNGNGTYRIYFNDTDLNWTDHQWINYFLVVDPAGIRTTGYRNTVTYLILDNGKGAIPGEEGTNNYYVDVLFYLSSLYVKENSRVHITSLHLSYSSKAVDNGYDLDTNGIIDLDSLFTTDADGNSRIVDIADSAALGLTGDYAIGDGTNDIDIGAKEFAVGTPEGNGGPDATEYSGYNDILCAMVDGSTSASCAQVEGVCSVDTACSLERAMDAALSKNGSVPTIYLMDGTYDDNITLRKEVHLQSENHWGATISPTYGGPVTVLSGVNNNAVIDGLRIIPKDETASAAAIKIINSGSPTITNNLLMPNAHTSSRTDYGIYLYNASPTSIKIDGNTIVGFQEAGVYLYNADGAAFVAGLDDESDQIVIKNNSFSKNYGYNLNITNGASNILIYNNIFTGNYGTYGIYMYNSYPIYIMNNTLYANQLSTYVVRSTIVNTYVLENNIIANNTSATLYCDQGTQGTNISYNLIYGNSNNTGGYSSCTGGTDDNQIFADTLGFAEESGTTATIDTVTFDGDTVYVTFSESLGWEPSQYAATTSNKYFLITEDGEDEATNGFVITDNGENDVYLLYYDEGNDNDELVAGNTVHITQMKLSNDSEAANAGNPNTDDFIDLDTLWTLDIWGDTRVADGNIDIGAVESTLVPEAPTILFVDDTDASAGSENPTNLTKLAPVMSALCNTPTNCISAEIQVASDSDFLSLVWESGEIDVVDKNDGERIGDITYSGDALDYNTTYYWRIRMYSINSYGSWSTANTFEIPRALEFYNFDLGGAVQEDTSETIKWGSFGGNDTVTISYSTDDCNTKTEIASVVSSPNAPDTTQTQSWTIPNAADVCGASTCDTVKLCLDTSVGNHSAMSEEYFTIQAADGAAGIKYSRTFSDSNFSDLSGATSATISGGDVTFAAGDWGGDYVSYTNRKAITITEKSGSELTDFQVQVDVTYEDSMQVDFDDVRFTDSDGTTSLNYWLETKTDSTSATFWVKVPSIKTSSTATIYMYYGNGSAESVSDGAATFEFFDDFSGSAIDETKWVITNATGFSVADGLLTGTSTTGRLTSVNTFSEPIVIEARQIVNTVQTTSGHMVIGTYLSTSNAIGLIPTGDQTIWYRNNGQWLGAYSTAPAIATSWATYKLAAASGTVSLSMKNDDDSEYLGSTSNTISSEPIAISKRYSDDYTGYTYDADWDWIRTRQYASTEPTSEIGSEETYTPPADQVVLYAAPDTIGIVSNFAATSSGTGTVTFRISDDNGVTWYYCSGDTLTEGATKNTAAELTNNCLDDLSGESFNVETTLSVSLGQTATLSDISYNITYIPSVSFTSASQQAAENAGNITITAELSSVYGSDVTIPYTITGTATDNTDYSITASPLVITAGNTTGDVTISITSDTADEENETVIVTMGELINATAGEITEHTAAILDDDNPPAISINDIAVDEGDADSTTATFTVSLSTASGKTVTVDYASADNTAEAGSDYTAKGTTTLTFNAGETEQSATVSVLGDVLDEDNETFYVNLSNASNGTISDSQGAGTITDDDATPTLNIDDKTVGEADGTVQFTITLSAASGKAVSVDYATGDSSALAGSDYTAASNTATIAAGETTAVVNITIANDTIDEDDEIFNVNLTNPSNATIADAQGVGTITDDDLAPTLSITDVDVTEGNSGSVAATFAVSLSAVSGKVITVAYATANGTALAGADYTATSGTLSFSAGESAKNIVVSVTGDTMDEDNEAYTVVLSDPSNATILDASGIGTITDDDATPSISLSTISSSVAEGASAVIIAELSAASGKVITVPITTGGTATLTTDYTYTPSSLSFAAGETSKTITVSAVDDSTSESSEAAIFTLGSPTNASLGSNKIYTLTITGTSGTFALTFGSATGCTGTSSLTCLVNEGDAISIPITGATHSSITITTNPLPSGALFSSTQLGTSRSGTFTWTPADGTEGSYTIIFTGIAGNGETDSKTALINVVKGDTLPTVSLSTSDNTKVAGGTVILTANAVDADGDPLTYHWMKTSGEGPSVESNTGSLLAFTIPSLSSLPGNRQGMVFAFKVTVEDDDGNEAFDTIIIRGMKPSIVAGEDSAETTTELVEGDVIDYANIDGSMLAVKVAEVDGTNSLITIENDSEVLYTYEIPEENRIGDLIVRDMGDTSDEDLMVSVPAYSSNFGAVYQMYEQSSGTLNPDAMPAGLNVPIIGHGRAEDSVKPYIGEHMAVGDYNADGTNDLVFTGFDNVYLFLGMSEVNTESLSLLQADYTIENISDIEEMELVDVDGNSQADLVYVTSSGELHVIPDSLFTAGYVDHDLMADLIHADLTRALGTSGTGLSISYGDYNADGIQDVAMGNGASNQVVIYYGVAGLSGSLSSSAANVTITSSNKGDLFGSQLASGDVDGDGIRDLIIAAPGNDNQGTDAGAFYVMYGSASLAATMTTDDLLAIYHDTEAEEGGYRLITADLNGDGVDEVIYGTCVSKSIITYMSGLTVASNEMLVTLGDENPSEQELSGTTNNNVVMMQLRVTNILDEDAMFNSIALTGGGNADDVLDVAAVRLYVDADVDGAISDGDYQIGTDQKFTEDNGTITFSDLAIVIGGGDSIYVLIVYDIQLYMQYTGSGLSIIGDNNTGDKLPISVAIILLTMIIILSIGKKRTMNKIIIGLALLSQVFVLSACGGSSSDVSGETTFSVSVTSNENVVVETSASKAAVDVAGAPVTSSTVTIK